MAKSNTAVPSDGTSILSAMQIKNIQVIIGFILSLIPKIKLPTNPTGWNFSVYLESDHLLPPQCYHYVKTTIISHCYYCDSILSGLAASMNIAHIDTLSKFKSDCVFFYLNLSNNIFLLNKRKGTQHCLQLSLLYCLTSFAMTVNPYLLPTNHMDHLAILSIC